MDVVKHQELVSEEINDLNGGGWLADTPSGNDRKEGVSFGALLCNMVDLATIF